MNNKIIIAMLLIIIALLVVLGVILINPADAKTDTKITVTSNSTLYDGDYFSISLNDANGTPITNQTVKIGIIDAKGGENPQKVTTDAMGNGMLQLNGLSAGEYRLNVTYVGNDHFKSSNATQKLTIKEKVKQSAGTGNSYVDRILNDPSCHVVKDPYSICPKHGVPYYQDSKCDWFVQPF
ncbi:adhesin [uncultured Methanobrevibacter sp.]|uniref:adhesin n=1 Tax=uncultured Methanobrevibacter sp. TaxID=253161 RepID=UPI0025D09722|nr:adhesin [uncultured Methanobrevibacter sp.]